MAARTSATSASFRDAVSPIRDRTDACVLLHRTELQGISFDLPLPVRLPRQCVWIGLIAWLALAAAGVVFN